MINSICIVRLSALGDVLMLVPLVRTIQDHLPQAKITWIISRPAFDLVEEMENVEFIVIDKPHNLKSYWDFYQRMKSSTFDVLIAAQASFRANLLYALIRARRKIGYDPLRAKDGHGWFVNETIRPGNDHTLEGFLKFAEPLGIKEKSIRWDLPISAQAFAWADAQISGAKPVLLVNPAASKPERSWLIERYIAVIKHAQQRWDMQVILIGGPGAYDQQLAAGITKEVDCLSLVGKTKPKQLLALISRAQLVVCPDTGPSHMAAAVGTPVIALHAVTSSEVSGPYTFKSYAVDYYPQAVSEVLQKTLATNIWGTHAHGEKTMELVPVAPVIQRLDQVMGAG